jgi:excisionase family DNA binding protein
MVTKARKKFGDRGLMTIRSACSRLNISRTTLWRRIRDNRIKAKRDGLAVKICTRSVEEYIDRLPEW